MAQREYMDLLELQERIKEGIEDAFPERYWVKAEIASFSPRSNGHCYLELSQSRGGQPVAQSRAMIWKWYYPRLKAFFEQAAGQPLQAGITVLVKVQVSYSELYGISLFIEDIDPAFTLGEKALERKRTIEFLTREGYMDMQQELALPELPYRLAVITSKTAAGYGDFRRHLLENEEGYAFRLDLYEALMQGEQAPASILSAILEVQEQPYDALLILRGGGSDLDLACFDDPDLAVAIATCPIPVVTAIGHDRDVHIADLVAHTSVKTPTALADLFLDAFEVFTPVCNTAEMSKTTREELDNAYDNTIVYTDWLVHQVIEVLRSFPDRRTCLLFISDHGESLGENNVYMHGLPYSMAPKEQVEIPMLVWSSDKSLQYKDLPEVGQHYVYHSVLRFFGIESPVFNEELCIFAP